jgi:hypothetical protein
MKHAPLLKFHAHTCLHFGPIVVCPFIRASSLAIKALHFDGKDSVTFVFVEKGWDTYHRVTPLTHIHLVVVTSQDLEASNATQKI